jgi:MFS family permease
MPGETKRVMVAAVVCLILAMGIRQSFGIFLAPIAMEVGRQVFGLAIVLQNLLWGLAQPFAGAIADEFGAVKVTIAGAALYAVGLALAAFAADPLQLNVTLGVLVGLALAGTTYVTVLGAVGRVVPPAKRSTAFGLCTAAGSFGMFAVVPGAQALLDVFAWRDAFLVLAVAVGSLIPLAFGFGGSDRLIRGRAAGQTITAAIREAREHSGYWLNAGFFVCGFHVAFVATHLPAYLADEGLPPSVSAWSLAMIGLFNIFGSYMFGVLGGRFRQKWVLAAIYLARAAVIALFLALPLSGLSAMAFGAAWGGGWAYDVLGSYEACGSPRSDLRCSPPSSICRSRIDRW